MERKKIHNCINEDCKPSQLLNKEEVLKILNKYYKGFNKDCIFCGFKDKSFNEIMKNFKGENQ